MNKNQAQPPKFQSFSFLQLRSNYKPSLLLIVQTLWYLQGNTVY